MSHDALTDLVSDASVVLVIGPGGVGKTTLAAAMASAAVEDHQRRVLVVTVDPARRLADALGVAELPSEPVRVPLDGEGGELWALMVDMARSWDELVTTIAPNRRVADSLLRNPLYRALTTRFVQSHDYIALDHLCDLAEAGEYDLVIIDTPPSSHAIDVLDAPDRMIDFFDSRLLRWLTAPYRSRVVQATARPFLAMVENLLGGEFLARIGEFFWRFSQLQPGFVSRANRVKRRLDDPATSYVLATSSDPASVAQTDYLLRELVDRHHRPALVIHNRAVTRPDDPVVDDRLLDGITDPSLRAAIEVVARRDENLEPLLASPAMKGVSLVTVPWRSVDVGSASELARLLDPSPPPSNSAL